MADEMNVFIAKVNDAFHNVMAPNKNDVSVKEDWDSKFIDKIFGGYLLGKEDETVILCNYKSIPALTPAAFLYFLPVYLRFAILNPESDVAEYLVLHFSSNANSEYWKERRQFINKKQQEIICESIKYLRFKGELSLVDDLAEQAIFNWCKK